ncbi:hypothetical protein CHUAL_000140 [Chamberlinius hualienensis]
MGDLSTMVSLTWADHFRVFLSGMWSCYMEKYKTDVEVYCCGHRVNVHQIVLAIFCPEFKQQQQQQHGGADINMCFDSPVELEDADLGLLIEFMYRGKITLSREKLTVIREAASAFGLQVLADLIDELVDENKSTTTSNILQEDEDNSTVDKSTEKLLQLPPFDSICTPEPTTTDELPENSQKDTDNLQNNKPKRSRRSTAKYDSAESKNPPKKKDNFKVVENDEEDEMEDSSSSFDESLCKKSSNSPLKRRGDGSLKSKIIRKPKQYLKCPHCNYGTNRKQLYLNHLDTHDRSVKRYVCEICSKAFRNNSSFGRHVYFHKNPDKLLKCGHCDYNTMQRSVWVQHLAIRHQLDPEGKPLNKDVRCSECDFVCITDYQLKSHVLRKHSTKSFKCDECDYCSVMRADLEKHVQIKHRNIRPYMCETCGYRSKTRSHFNCHLQMHTGVKPFKCHICGQAYTRSNKLKEHLKMHVSDEKPFLCHLCSYACRRNYNLKLHIKRIHKDKDGGGVPKNIQIIAPINNASSSPSADADLAVTANQQSLLSNLLTSSTTEMPLVLTGQESTGESVILVENVVKGEDKMVVDDDGSQTVIQLQAIEPIAVVDGVSLTTVCMTGLECLQPYQPID